MKNRERMVKYKICVSIDGNNSFWIVVDNGRFIRNPTKEDLKGAEFKIYSDDNICSVCREENTVTDKSILYPRNSFHNTDKNGNKTDEWVCKRHGERNYKRYNPNSLENKLKLVRNCRTGYIIDPYKILGNNCEEETYRLFGAKKSSEEFDNYRLPVDHCPIPNGVSVKIGEKLLDLSGNIVQTKGGFYSSKYRWWSMKSLSRELTKKYDMLIFYCVSENGSTIERIYIFPYSEIIKRISIGIYRHDPKGNLYLRGWYEKYRVTEEDTLKKANNIWKEIIGTIKITYK